MNPHDSQQSHVPAFKYFRCIDCGYTGVITTEEIDRHRKRCATGTTEPLRTIPTSSALAPLLPKHKWRESGDQEKPWTCEECGFLTANLRHIRNGYCQHIWVTTRHGRDACKRCHVVMNERNRERACIGKVEKELRDESSMSAMYSEVEMESERLRSRLMGLEDGASAFDSENSELKAKLATLEHENAELKRVLQDVRSEICNIGNRVSTHSLEAAMNCIGIVLTTIDVATVHTQEPIPQAREEKS